MKPRYTASEIATCLGADLSGDGSVVLTGFAQADRAKTGDLTFAENETYFAKAEQSTAAAVVTPLGFASTRKVLLRVANPRVAYAQVLPLFFPEPVFAPGIHPSAVIAPGAQVDPTAHIGPCCVVSEGARVGPRTVLEAGDYLGPGCVLAEDVRLFPNVTLYARTQLGARVIVHSGAVIGSDGFGYVLDQGKHLKVPQIGNVLIHDDVEIGANVTIDRGALGPTVIGRGTKIDNLVQIAHNVQVGEGCLLVAQVGIAGSTKVGNFVTMAGQVGIAGHLKIGNQATVGAKAGVMHDIPDGEKWLGTPAQPDRQFKRLVVATQQLPDLFKRLSQLERELVELKKNAT